MDYSRRHRYRTRRRAIEARRRALILIGLAAGVLVVFLASFAWPRRTSPSPAQTAPVTGAAPTIAARTQQAQVQPTGESAQLAAEAQPTTPEARPLVPATYFDGQRLTYEPGYHSPQIQATLESFPGPLKGMSFSVGGRRHSFSEVILGQSLYYSINPKVVLALLESQGRLLSTERPSPEQLDWAIGFRGEDEKRKGLTAQIRWAVRQMQYGRREFAEYVPLTYADKSTASPPPGMEFSQYVIARVLAPTTSPEKLPERMQAFLDTYTQLFGDPRTPPTDLPLPSKPFLVRPTTRTVQVTSFFDHDTPFLSKNGSIFTYWGRSETTLSYDGHDGWDYAVGAPEPALAAADGEVVFAGNADDNCATTAVVIDHGNGYRTLYWHLSATRVQIGQRVTAGEIVGITGASGCAYGEHLHFGVQYLGRNTDPYGYCGMTPDLWAQHPAGTNSIWLWKDRPSPCGPAPEGAVVVDTDSPSFSRTGPGWQEAPLGYGGTSLFARSILSESVIQTVVARAAATGTPKATPEATPTPLPEPSVATYRPTLPQAGKYRVLAYIPYVLNGLDDATAVFYRVRHIGGDTEVVIDERQYANDWADLGVYDFTPDAAQVTIDNRTNAEYQGVLVDAIMWLPVE